jgi:hypothetical protein
MTGASFMKLFRSNIAFLNANGLYFSMISFSFQCSFGSTEPFTGIWIHGIQRNHPILQDAFKNHEYRYSYNFVFQAALMTFRSVSVAEDFYRRLNKVPGVQVRVISKIFPPIFASCLFLGGFFY